MRRTVLIFLVIGSAIGCMDDLHDYDDCVELEGARCELRDECQSKSVPEFDKAFPGFDLDTCLTYAAEHCRTREIGGNGRVWGVKDVSACKAGILGFPCKSLTPREDETTRIAACDFLENPVEPEAPADAGDTDTASDTSVDTSTETASDATGDTSSD